MLSSQWMKAVRDLLINKTRATLVILAITIGVFGCGFIINSYTILLREMDRNYMDTNPASFVLFADSVDDTLIETVRAFPGINDAEPRRKVVGRIRKGQFEWQTIWLYVIEDFEAVRIDGFSREDGRYPAARGEILLERAAVSVAQSDIGDGLVVKLPERNEQTLSVIGTVHAPGLAPSWMENIAYGFINQDTYLDLGGREGFGELRVIVAQDRFNVNYLRQVAHEVRLFAEKKGYAITGVEVPRPGKHPHADQLSALLFLLQAFGGLALVLSGLLVVNMFSGMLAGELRQIGIMKAIGGQSRQIMGIYYSAVIILGTIALVVALPVSVGASRVYSVFAAEMLNFEIASFSIPFWAYLIQAFIGLLIPLSAASFPIWKSGRITVREALTSYGVKENYQLGFFERILGRIQGTSRLWLLTVGNAVRKKGRFALTLGTLAMGGAFFIVALNVGASIEHTVANSFKTLRYDLELSLTRVHPVEKIKEIVEDVPGVSTMEIWGDARATVIHSNGISGNSFRLMALPSDTEFLRLPLVSGRWLNEEEQEMIVINHILEEQVPGVKAGDLLAVGIAGKRFNWRVAGVVREIGSFPRAYIRRDYFEDAIDSTDRTQNLVVRIRRVEPLKTSGHMTIIDHLHGRSSAMEMQTNSYAERVLSGTLIDKLTTSGIDVTESWNISLYRKVFEDHLQIIVAFLIIMSLLIVAVGSLGLASTMSMNVMERMREIGVMRSIGASDKDIYRIIVGEGVLIGAMSWIVAVLLSIPLTVWVANTFGAIFFHTSLDVAMTHSGLALWLLMVILITALAGYFPARKAVGLAVRDVLAYE